MISSDFIKGFAVGVGVAIAVPVATVALLTGGRPLVRALTRGADMLADKAREAAWETGEIIEDLIAESRADLAGAEAAQGLADDESVASADWTEETGDAARGQD